LVSIDNDIVFAQLDAFVGTESKCYYCSKENIGTRCKCGIPFCYQCTKKHTKMENNGMKLECPNKCGHVMNVTHIYPI
jgi:hypothetical protein